MGSLLRPRPTLTRATRKSPLALVRTALRHAVGQDPRLYRRGARLLVAYSGGQDSTCLLHALADLGVRRGFEVAAAHVDHGLRPESAEEAHRVVELARRLGVSSHVVRGDVAGYREEQRQRRWSVQQCARAVRYQLLAALAHQLGSDALVVAHSADDQAETFMLNLLRGSGLAGLSGMGAVEEMAPSAWGPPAREVRDGARSLPYSLTVARPLLSVERATTRDYCVTLGLEIVDDRSNLSRVYTRNRIRHDVLPVLERFNPSVRRALARTAALVGDDLAALDQLTRERYRGLARGGEGRRVVFELGAWRDQPRGVQRRLLRLAIESLLGDLVDVPAAPIEDALDYVVSPEGTEARAYDLPRGVRLSLDGDRLVLERAP